MAWKDTLLDCSYKGFVFDIRDVDDTAARATAEHAYPYVDGADIEDLGMGPNAAAVEAVFWGNDYEQRLQQFLKVLAQPGDGELIHPIFGSIKNALWRNRRIRHQADDVDQCLVSLEFVASTPSNPFFDRTLPSQKVGAISQRSGIAKNALANALGNAIDTLRNASPLASLNSLRQSMLGPVLATFSQVQGVVLSGMDVVNFPRAWAHDISSIADGILNLKDFGSNLMGDWASVGNVFRLFDSFGSSGSKNTGTGGSGNAAPAQILPGASPTESQAVAVTQAHVTAATALGVADAASLVLTAEADPEHGLTLSPVEIESVVGDARTRIEGAIEAVRAIYPLETARTITEPMKDLALALQEAAQAIIEARPPLVQKAVEAPGNLRLLAHRWYGDHNRATELARLNPDLRLPNAMQAGDVLNAYAV